MYHPLENRKAISLAVAGACAAIALQASAQQVAPAPSAPAADGAVQIVTVSGFRSSLEKALNSKRASVTTRDSIVAEDIGKFPEQNIADAMIRLPGVEVVRDGNSNEGQRIQLRGLGSEYTVTTFNGAPVRATSSGNVGASTRDFNYDVFASELFGKADVYKGPLAELEEGGIAGVVDLNTPRPFDKKGRVIRYSVAGARNLDSGYTSPRGHILISDTWGNVGFLASVASSRARNANAGFHSTGIFNSTLQRGVANAANYTFDTTAPGARLGAVTPDQLDNANLPRFFRVAGQDNIRQRTGFNTSLQYKTAALDLSWDTLYSRLSDDAKTNYLNFMVRDSIGARSLIPVDVRVDANNNLQGTLGNLTMGTNALNSLSQTDFRYNALNGKWHVNNRLRLTGQATVSQSEAWRNSSTMTAEGLDPASRHTLTFDTGNPLFPDLKTNRDLLDPTLYTSFSYGGFYRIETDKQKTVKLVADYDYGIGSVEGRLKVGLSSVESTKLASATLASNLLNGQSIPNVGLYSAATPAQRAAFARAFLIPNDLKNFGSAGSDNYPRDWLTFGRDFTVGTLDALGKNRAAPANLGGTFSAVETVTALFVQTDLSTELFARDLRTNIGVRYVRTETDIDNYKLSGAGVYSPASASSSYTNLLPALNSSYDLTEDLVLRASWGKTISRSSISLLGRAFDVPFPGFLTVNSGNPDLKPERSTNLDTSLEWYFDKGGIVALSAFQKDIEGRAVGVSRSVPFNSLGLPKELWFTNVQAVLEANPAEAVELKSYQNADNYKVRGVEFAYQQSFKSLPAPWNGLGAIASLTRIDTAGIARTYNGVSHELPIVPKTTYALTLYYEKGPLSLRTSYNHKSEYANTAETSANPLGYQRWYKARGYLDASVGYKINDKLEVRLDGANLTNTETYEFLRHFEGKHGDEHSRIDSGYRAGATATVSLRGSF